MTRWTLMFTLFTSTLFAASVSAAEEIASFLITGKEDGETSSTIGFGYDSCGGECHVATLSCGERGAITITLADIDAENAAKAITQETKQILLSVGGKDFDYSVSDMQYAEMTGSWWLTAHTQDVHARELAPAIAASKTVEALVGGQKVVLPVDKNFQS